jgi:C-terminal domain 7 of the ABC-three component (ABC-3C) systems
MPKKGNASRLPVFSAAAPLVGYLYQCRYALLDALRRAREGKEFLCRIEALDDIQFENDDNTIDLLQTKHHISKKAKLTDSSVDLWKTLRIWAEAIQKGTLNESATLYLITTSIAPQGSAASYLRRLGSDYAPQDALTRLNSIAESLTNKSNTEAYDAFKSLSINQKDFLVSSICIIDGTPSIDELDDALQREVFWAVEQRNIDSFLRRLEGWWLKRVIGHLTKPNSPAILSEEVSDEMSSLREQFKIDNLPIDSDILDITVDASGYRDKAFIKQLELINIGSRRILFAIQNYFRAATQRSRWVREDLIIVGDIEKYENRLKEEWELRFEQMKDDLGEDVAETAKLDAARTLFKFFETGELPPIRPACTEPFIARGTYQMLSDELKVGWHIEFRERLNDMLKEIS